MQAKFNFGNVFLATFILISCNQTPQSLEVDTEIFAAYGMKILVPEEA